MKWKKQGNKLDAGCLMLDAATSEEQAASILKKQNLKLRRKAK
jgi:hypothetical protein